MFARAYRDPEFRRAVGGSIYPRGELEEIASLAKTVTLVAVAPDGKVHGWVVAMVLTKRWASLEVMYVAPAYRKEGAATLLLAELRRHLKRRGVGYLSSLVKVSEMKLLAWYRAAGFGLRGDYSWLDMDP